MGLVLSRKKGETVRMVVPPSATPRVIEVTYLEQRGHKSRWLLDADRDVNIVRGEIGVGDGDAGAE